MYVAARSLYNFAPYSIGAPRVDTLGPVLSFLSHFSRVSDFIQNFSKTCLKVGLSWGSGFLHRGNCTMSCIINNIFIILNLYIAAMVTAVLQDNSSNLHTIV